MQSSMRMRKMRKSAVVKIDEKGMTDPRHGCYVEKWLPALSTDRVSEGESK